MTQTPADRILDRWRAVTALMESGAGNHGKHPLAGRAPFAVDKKGTTTEIYIYGPISRYGFFEDVVSARSVIKTLKDVDTDRIDLHIHSPGGDSFEGVAILNAFRNHPAEVTVHVDGIAASAASFIAMCGEEIVMGRGSQMMIHDASMLTWGNAAQLHDDADWLDKQSQNIATIYADRAGGTAKAWRDLMLAETWYTADEAVAAGLADRVAGKAEKVDDPEETAAPAEEAPDVEDMFDLSIFAHAGRSKAPAPQLPTASADGPINTEGGTDMSFIDDVRTKLGVAEDADEATIVAALDEALEERAEPNAAAATPPEGMVLVDATVLAELRQHAEQGRQARQQQLEDERDRTIEAAIRAGKTTPARREHWTKAWDADPEGTRAVLDSLEAGLVPVSEKGHEGGVDQTADDAAYLALFPDEKKAV